jgi:hypothetical protein
MNRQFNIFYFHENSLLNLQDYGKSAPLKRIFTFTKIRYST